MEKIKKIIEKYGIEVISTNKNFIQIRYNNHSLAINGFDLFGLLEQNIINHIKEKYRDHNIEINLNKSKNKKRFLSIDEKKNNIRKTLSTKFKLL